MAIQRWDPLRDLLQMQEKVNRLFEDTLTRSSVSGGSAEVAGGGWRPPMDLFEEPELYLLRADLPGVDPSEVEIEFEDGRLCVRGERRMDGRVAREAYLRVERPYGRFSTHVALPSSVDLQSIRASHQNGVLEVILPKKKQVAPGRIEVASK